MPRAFEFVPLNPRQHKPRTRGITEIRGPYYTPLGPRALADILDTMGEWVDALKFAGGAFALMPRDALVTIIELCHQHKVRVSTGGFIERLLARDPGSIERYLDTCREVGFDVVEISSGFITLPTEDFARLVERVVKRGLAAKAEVGIQFGAGGASSPELLASAGSRDVRLAIDQAKRMLDAGAYQIMIESEGITEDVKAWRTDVISEIVAALGLERVMFEAADPAVFTWYVKTFGPEVNLFVDHSQIVQLEALRSGIWGTHDVWGRVVAYKP
jgi:phosphosulfolactate synthase (CoM biosynthesis protein A)